MANLIEEKINDVVQDVKVEVTEKKKKDKKSKKDKKDKKDKKSKRKLEDAMIGDVEEQKIPESKILKDLSEAQAELDSNPAAFQHVVQPEEEVEEEEQTQVEEQDDSQIPRAKRPNLRTKIEKPIVETKRDDATELFKQQEAIAYLTQFSQYKNNWKFRKIVQVYIFANIYTISKFDDKVFDIILEYIKDCKGQAREGLLTEAKQIYETEDPSTEVESNTFTLNKDEPKPLYTQSQKDRALKVISILS